MPLGTANPKLVERLGDIASCPNCFCRSSVIQSLRAGRDNTVKRKPACRLLYVLCGQELSLHRIMQNGLPNDSRRRVPYDDEHISTATERQRQRQRISGESQNQHNRVAGATNQTDRLLLIIQDSPMRLWDWTVPRPAYTACHLVRSLRSLGMCHMDERESNLGAIELN